MRKPEKIQCEICGEKNKKILHRHHIVERKDINTSNHPFNLSVLCPNCHGKTHRGEIKIIGVYPSTGVGGRTLVYEINNKINVDGINSAYFTYKAPSMEVKGKT